jgi:threonine dehydrogenase-like Zn-dependent dehydrogenase
VAQALILDAPRLLRIVEEPDVALRPGEVRVETLHSGISAGTEIATYRGTNPHQTKQWDASARVFRDARAVPAYPVMTLGYAEVGRVVESADERIAVHSMVAGRWGHRTHAVVAGDVAVDGILDTGTDPLIGIFSHLGAIALNAVHDAEVGIGETAVVYGLGPIGLLITALLHASGVRVVGVDPIGGRRELAASMGAAITIDPTVESASDAVRSLTDGIGADVCIEASGNVSALHDAVRAAAPNSQVVAVGFVQGGAPSLVLGEEFHHNRVALVSSQIGAVAPSRSHRWSRRRLWRAAIALQTSGLVDFRPVISHHVGFDRSPTMFDRLDGAAGDVVLAVIDFP